MKLTSLAVNNLGPQTSYPVPEGILNHSGENYVALTIWSMESDGAKLDGLSLGANAIIQSGYAKPALVEGDVYSARSAY